MQLGDAPARRAFFDAPDTALLEWSPQTGGNGRHYAAAYAFFAYVRARYGDRMTTGFLKPALIDQQAAIAMASKQPVCLQSHLIDHRLMIPRRVRQHMLQLLLIRIRNPFLHSLHILFVWVGLHESFQIVPDRRDNRARSVLKMRLETPMKLGESAGQFIKWIYTGIRIIKSPYA